MALTDLAGQQQTGQQATQRTDEPVRRDGEPLAAGTRVEVRMRLDTRRWNRGFEIISAGDDGYVLRRLSDGETLPRAVPFDEVREERKRSQWWY